MFGYVTPLIREMKVGEYWLYRAYYCGLCKALQTEYKKSAALNFDCAFLYLLADSLQNNETDVQPARCALHPVRGRSKVVSPCASFAAAVNVLMAAAKLDDDVADGGGMTARLRRLLFRRAYKKAAKQLPGLNQKMLETAARLHELETAGSADTDAAADTYARLLGGVLEDMDVVQSHILYELGYNIGRWTYLVDAYDDVEEDLKTGNYNVYAAKYGAGARENGAAKKEIELGLHFTLSRAADALSRLGLKKNRNILQNIVSLGLLERTKNVLAGTDGGYGNRYLDGEIG